MKGRNNIIKKPVTRINHAIRASEVRVIDETGAQVGVMKLSQALQRAEVAGLDLIEVSPGAQPPVARIADWGKYKYEKDKQLRQQRKQQKLIEIKQMRVGMRISENDLLIKLGKVRRFLESGDKVKIVLLYRGRENAHKELGFGLFEKISQQLADIAVVDQPAQLSGRSLTIVYRSSK